MIEETPSEEGWEILSTSVTGIELKKPHLGIRRRKHSKRRDHITSVSIILIMNNV
jgi:hypothetical protein